MKHEMFSSPRHRPTRLLPIRLSAGTRALRRQTWMLASGLLAIAVLSGCASTQTDRERLVHENLPRPDHIWIHDFAATPAEIPSDSALAGRVSPPATPETPEQLALGRRLGNGITTQLVDEVRKMGLPAERGRPGTTPQINDIIIRGYLVSVDPGSASKRVTIGFGSGGSELTTAVEGFQMTAEGPRRLGSGTAGAKGSKSPGTALGAATMLVTSPVGLVVGGGLKVYGEASGSSRIEGRARQTAMEIAREFKRRAQEEGWIN